MIIAHLFPSNDSYSDFWNASSIGAGIMDENLHSTAVRSLRLLQLKPRSLKAARWEAKPLREFTARQLLRCQEQGKGLQKALESKGLWK